MYRKDLFDAQMLIDSSSDSVGVKCLKAFHSGLFLFWEVIRARDPGSNPGRSIFKDLYEILGFQLIQPGSGNFPVKTSANHQCP